VYPLTVQSEDKASKKSTLSIWMVGDQGKAPAEISSARQKDGKPVPVKGTGVLDRGFFRIGKERCTSNSS